MTAKKTAKKPTELETLKARINNLEFAVCEGYNNFDEVFALLRVYRDYIDSPNYSKYTAKDAVNGIFSLLIKNQMDMAQYADLDI